MASDRKIEKINQSTFKIDNLGEVKPKIVLGGDDPSRFVPNVNMSFGFGRGEEFFINLNNSFKTITSQVAILSGDKITQTVNNESEEYYVDSNGRLKWDTVFSVKPGKMKINYDIQYSEGITFDYQDTLENEYKASSAEVKKLETLDQYINSRRRPDDVIGSYAVYCNKAHNQYKTGKICHIPRPHVVDADGKMEWCELKINNGLLTITLPESFMNSAKYPVRLDPTFGYDTQGGTALSVDSGTACRGSLFNTYAASVGDTITKFSICASEGTGTINAAAYTIVAGDLSAWLNGRTAISVGVTKDWYHSSAVSIAMAAATYGVAMEFNDLTVARNIYYDASAGGAKRHNSTLFANPWVTNASYDYKFSFYATYTAAGGGSRARLRNISLNKYVRL